jgi:putative sterol carrier protein
MAEQMDLSQVTPEQFAEMVKGASDEDIKAAFNAVGTDQVLNRVFEGMQDRFQPDKAQGVDADIQWVITDDGTEHPYFTKIHNGSCEAGPGTVDDPKVTLTTDVASFTKLITNQAQGPQLFMGGKLRVAGDVMFSARIQSFFDQPKA